MTPEELKVPPTPVEQAMLVEATSSVPEMNAIARRMAITIDALTAENERLKEQLRLALAPAVAEVCLKPSRIELERAIGTLTAQNVMMTSERDALQKRVEELQGWKTAVIDAAIVGWTYTKQDEDDPRHAVNALLCQSQKMALDPAVSEDARKLHDRIADRDALKAENERLKADLGLSLDDIFRRRIEDLEKQRNKTIVERDALRQRVAELERKLGGAAEAALLFFTAPFWSDLESARWKELTGQDEATTKVLCDTLRAARKP